MQALSLASLIDNGVARGAFSLPNQCLFSLTNLAEGYIGMAIVGGVAAVGALLFAGIVRRARSH